MSANKPTAKAGKDVIYIDLDDEITSIIDKVENAKDKVVALVLPKRAAVLQSIVNMRLLKRAADTSGKNVVLISSEPAILPLAGAAGLHVAKNLQSTPNVPPSPIPVHEGPAKTATSDATALADEEIDEGDAKIDYDRSIGELAAANEVEEPETIPLDDEETAAAVASGLSLPDKLKAAKDKGLKVPNFDKFRLSMGLIIGGVVLLIIFIILALFVLPKATVTLKTTSLPVSANFNLVADGGAKTLDEANGVIPATLQTKDQTATSTVTATGKQNNGDKASGSVTMSAQDCSAPFSTPPDVPAGAGISSNGLTYITQAKTSFSISGAAGNCVNYAATSSTSIKAQTGGSNYNISSATFSVSGRPDVSASGSASGGTDNVATVLSQADVDGAKQKITSADTDQFTKDWQTSLGNQGLYLISPTLKLGDPVVTSSVPVGQPASTASITIKITYSILAVKNDDLKKVVTDQTNKQIDSSKQKLSGDDPLTGLTITVTSQDSPTKANLQLSVNTTAVPILDVAGIKKTAAGRKSGDIQAALSNLPGVKEVDVKLSPFWVSKAPKAGKIKVVQQQVSSGNTSP